MRSDSSRCQYIGSGQVTVMIAVFAVLYCVSMAVYTDCGSMLADTAVSALTLGVLAIPLAVLTHSGRDVIGTFFAKSKAAGILISLLYLLYFISAAADMLMHFGGTAARRYFPEGGRLVCILLLGIVCVYISWAGIMAVCRMSTVILFLLLFTSAVLLLLALNDFTVPVMELHPLQLSADSLGGIFPPLAAGLTSVCILCAGMGKRTQKGLFGGLAAALAAAAAIIAAVFAVLGSFARVSDFPLSDAVIYAARELSFRPDGLFFSLWTVMAAAATALLCACGGEALGRILPSVRGKGIITAAIAVACAACGVLFPRIGSIPGSVYRSPLAAAVLLGLLPLTALLLDSKSTKKEANP